MVGLTTDDIEKMRDFANTPKYERTPEMLAGEAREADEDAAESAGD